jgi:hypothetical protein
VYEIYPQTEYPHIDVDSHMKNWLAFLRIHYGRDLKPDDFIFPSVGSNTTLHPSSHISHDIIQQWIDEFASKSGINLTAGKLTTHCFRRGGAQDRFMVAPNGTRWPLSVIVWWAGWSPGEGVSVGLETVGFFPHTALMTDY